MFSIFSFNIDATTCVFPQRGSLLKPVGIYVLHSIIPGLPVFCTIMRMEMQLVWPLFQYKLNPILKGGFKKVVDHEILITTITEWQ